MGQIYRELLFTLLLLRHRSKLTRNRSNQKRLLNPNYPPLVIDNVRNMICDAVA